MNIEELDRKYLVVASFNDTDDKSAHDYYEVAFNYDEAERIYDRLSEREELFALSICAVIKSTDYDTHERFLPL